MIDIIIGVRLAVNRELVLLKPDAIERKLVGKIIAEFEDNGFKIIRLKKALMSDILIGLIYPDSPDQLRGMGEKTVKALTDKGEKAKIMEMFGTTVPIEIGTKLNAWNRKYMAYNEIVGIVVEREKAPETAKELVGEADPKTAAKDTIRGKYGNDSIYQANIEKRAVRNLIHAADLDRAQIEIGYFFEHFF